MVVSIVQLLAIAQGSPQGADKLKCYKTLTHTHTQAHIHTHLATK